MSDFVGFSYPVCHRWIDEAQGTRCIMSDGHAGPRRATVPWERTTSEAELVEAMARVLCIASGFDPDDMMANDGPRWRYYTPGDIATIPIIAAQRAEGFRAGVEASAKALEADAQLCDCHARSEGECAWGAWDDNKSITSARAVQIVRELKDQTDVPA